MANGVIVLATAAGALLIAFGGKTNALIPLYAVGVFLSFTLSQAGMVRHHQKEREKGYQRNIVINAVGSVATLIVLLIVAGTKFTSGAWVPLIVIPIIVFVFKSIKRHYRTVADGLRVTPDYKPRRMNHTVVVLVGGVHRGVLEALAYARSINPNHLVAVSVVLLPEKIAISAITTAAAIAPPIRSGVLLGRLASGLWLADAPTTGFEPEVDPESGESELPPAMPGLLCGVNEPVVDSMSTGF